MGTLLFAIASLGVLVAMVKAHADVRVSACSWHRRKARATTATYVPLVIQSHPWPIVVPKNEDEMDEAIEGIPLSLYVDFEHSEC